MQQHWAIYFEKLDKDLENLTLTLKNLTKKFENLDNFAEKNAEGWISTKKCLYEALCYYTIPYLV